VPGEVGREDVVIGLEAFAQAGEVVVRAADAVQEHEGLAAAVALPVQCRSHGPG
jgi:hypothetical protein